MIGTSAAFVTATLASAMPNATPAMKLAWSAALVNFTVYAINFVASSFLPEPKTKKLPD
jgi:hypothetical protein